MKDIIKQIYKLPLLYLLRFSCSNVRENLLKFPYHSSQNYVIISDMFLTDKRAHETNYIPKFN